MPDAGRREWTPRRRAVAAAWLAIGVLIGWVAWVMLLRAFPESLAGPVVGLGPRALLLLGPALLFLARIEGRAILPLPTGHLRVGIAWGLGCALIVPGLGIGVEALSGRLAWKEWPGLPALLSASVVTPIAEELMFRGVLYRVWRRTLGDLNAAVASAAAFALLHLPWYALAMSYGEAASAFGSVFLYGVGYAVLYRVSGSLWAPITAHALNNLALSLLRV